MTVPICRHADRPLVFTIVVGKVPQLVRAHRIHPVGEVLDGGRDAMACSGLAGSSPMADDWGRDVCDEADGDRVDGLMSDPPAVRRRQRLRPVRAAVYGGPAGLVTAGFPDAHR